MTTSSLPENDVFPFDSIFFHEQIDRVIEQTLPMLYRMIKWHVVFHLSFFLIGFVEVFLILFFMSDLLKLSLLAISLSALFFTFFSYFILRLYLAEKKPEQFASAIGEFSTLCQELIRFQKQIPEHRFALATAFSKFASVLHGNEINIWRVPPWLELLRPSIERFSRWWHWHDIHYMKENLLLKAVDEHLEIVKMEPTDLEVHAALANAYVTLSGVYINPHREQGFEVGKIPSEEYRKELMDRFRFTAERAIEEFKILNDYAPDDPWVHVQLAYSYRDLGMPEEEIGEYEIVLSLCPDDFDTLYRLGVLYFEQGYNAKGLEVYESLKKNHFKKAEQLISHYSDRHRALTLEPMISSFKRREND